MQRIVQLVQTKNLIVQSSLYCGRLR